MKKYAQQFVNQIYGKNISNALRKFVVKYIFSDKHITTLK